MCVQAYAAAIAAATRGLRRKIAAVPARERVIARTNPRGKARRPRSIGAKASSAAVHAAGHGTARRLSTSWKVATIATAKTTAPALAPATRSPSVNGIKKR
jgi:hypothetical protein